MTHGEVAEAARRWLHVPHYRIAIKEVGLPSGRRIDVLAFAPRSNEFRLVECKASARDLKGVVKQLEDYRRFADLLYVAVPDELEEAAKELLPKRVGLLVVTQQPGYNYLSTRAARNPRRVPIDGRTRRGMVTRALTWLLAHFEATRKCRNCGYVLPHGPV